MSAAQELTDKWTGGEDDNQSTVAETKQLGSPINNGLKSACDNESTQVLYTVK